jgi:hypothetical protein
MKPEKRCLCHHLFRCILRGSYEKDIDFNGW